MPLKYLEKQSILRWNINSFSEKIGRLPILLFFYNQPSRIFNARYPKTNLVRLNSLSMRRAVFHCKIWLTEAELEIYLKIFLCFCLLISVAILSLQSHFLPLVFGKIFSMQQKCYKIPLRRKWKKTVV